MKFCCSGTRGGDNPQILSNPQSATTSNFLKYLMIHTCKWNSSNPELAFYPLPSGKCRCLVYLQSYAQNQSLNHQLLLQTRDLELWLGWKMVGNRTSLFMQLAGSQSESNRKERLSQTWERNLNQYEDKNSMPWDVLEKGTTFRSNTCFTLAHPGTLELWLSHLGFSGEDQIIPRWDKEKDRATT